MITPAEALKKVLTQVAPLPVERAALDDALGRVLAAPVRADRDLPPADRSAMDGYAVRYADVARCPVTLRGLGEVAAGSPARRRVKPQTCIRIFTGSNIPPGADTVVMVEFTAAAADRVTFRTAPERGANILRRGEDARRGEVLLARGTVLWAGPLGVCAAVGLGRVAVHARPRVAVLGSGAELRPVGGAVASHQVRNSNGPTLAAALAQWGFPDRPYATVTDDLALLIRKIKNAVARHNLVIVTGGVSVGQYDFVPEAVRRAGGKLLFHGVAMKPGKPLLLARFARDRFLFGLPGNPLSCLVGCHEFVLPALRRMSGLSPEFCRPALRVELAGDLALKGGTIRHVLARLRWRDGVAQAEPVPSQSSADVVAGGKADGAIVAQPEPRLLPAGSAVEFRPWRPLP